MASIAIKLDPAKMENPDADIRYSIADRIQDITNNTVTDDGFDYLDDDTMVIFLASEQPDDGVKALIDLLKKETLSDNSILDTAIIGVDTGEGYSVVFPNDFNGDFRVE